MKQFLAAFEEAWPHLAIAWLAWCVLSLERRLAEREPDVVYVFAVDTLPTPAPAAPAAQVNHGPN